MNPQVTVLIPSFNPGAYLVDALRSVFGQTYPGWRIILVDDASTDNSLNQAGRYLHSPRVTLIQNKDNIGQSRSLNKALALVDTPYVLQLDSDDWLYPYTIGTLLKYAARLPLQTAVISGYINVVVEDDSGNIRYSFILKNSPYKNRYEFLLSNTSLCPRFYRTSALKKIGGWPLDDPFGGRYMEDRILFRLLEYYNFFCIDQVLYNHRRHSFNQTNKVEVYNVMKEWVVRDALKRWGDKYEPVFGVGRGGRKRLIGLVAK
ncbi:MAG TPA: glycosyltransferase family 2 protein [Firmicutes bacterium]|nr:glycosyltransferase family 2 protein [Bacillota bacterium]